MTSITARTEFDSTTTNARAAHQEAIRQAHAVFEDSLQRRQRKWRERLVAAKERFDALKSLEEPGEEFAAIKQEFEAASSASLDIEGPRKRLARDVAEADRALNETLAQARERLATA